jgi:hypothetical protein
MKAYKKNDLVYFFILKKNMKKFLLLFFTVMTVYILHAQQATPGDTSLKQYTGKYKFPDGSVVTEIIVSLDSAGVMTANSAMGSSELRRSQGDVFDVVVYGGTATFKRNGENKIIGVQIIVGDTNLEGTKTEDPSLTVFTEVISMIKKRYILPESCHPALL